MDQDTFDRIEAYVAGSLHGPALEQFERDMQADPALSAEVAVYRDMALALSPGPEVALRENLDALGKNYTTSEPPAKKRRPAIWIAAVALVALFAGWLVWEAVSGEKNFPSPGSRLPKQETSEPVAGGTSAPQNEAPVPAAKDPVSTEPVDDKPALIAADFRPNPRLEAMRGEQQAYRSGDFRFRISRPVADAGLKLENGQAVFHLSGTLETALDPAATPFRVLLFSNKPVDYENFRFLGSAALTFEKKGELYYFSVDKPLKVKPGLYYYLLEAKDSGMLFYVGKIRVLE